mmetsp:Transcript_89988/g.234524  ORF Transcript_89988/g.234524 Transcript_89988/m.234524 type:complete len:366 (+) Transcript_89988:661-1758(+)
MASGDRTSHARCAGAIRAGKASGAPRLLARVGAPPPRPGRSIASAAPTSQRDEHGRRRHGRGGHGPRRRRWKRWWRRRRWRWGGGRGRRGRRCYRGGLRSVGGHGLGFGDGRAGAEEERFRGACLVAAVLAPGGGRGAVAHRPGVQGRAPSTDMHALLVRRLLRPLPTRERCVRPEERARGPSYAARGVHLQSWRRRCIKQAPALADASFDFGVGPPLPPRGSRALPRGDPDGRDLRHHEAYGVPLRAAPRPHPVLASGHYGARPARSIEHSIGICGAAVVAPRAQLHVDGPQAQCPHRGQREGGHRGGILLRQEGGRRVRAEERLPRGLALEAYLKPGAGRIVLPVAGAGMGAAVRQADELPRR